MIFSWDSERWRSWRKQKMNWKQTSRFNQKNWAVLKLLLDRFQRNYRLCRSDPKKTRLNRILSGMCSLSSNKDRWVVLIFLLLMKLFKNCNSNVDCICIGGAWKESAMQPLFEIHLGAYYIDSLWALLLFRLQKRLCQRMHKVWAKM